MREACRILLDTYDEASTLRGTDRTAFLDENSIIGKFRETFRAELVALSEVYEIEMYRLIPSQETIEEADLTFLTEDQLLFTDLPGGNPVFDDR